MRKQNSAAITLLAMLTGVLFGGQAPDSAAAERASFDLVITGGRVMDPASHFDQVANVGIRNGLIAVISAERISGRVTLDAKGLVVAPGFIDLHAHAQSSEGQELQALDGVTTALDQEGGAYPIAAFYASHAGRSRINFGVSVGHQGLRVKVKTGLDMGHAPTVPAAESRALLVRKAEWAEASMSTDELKEMMRLFDAEISAGGLGLGLAIE